MSDASVFSADEARGLAALLDTLIPPSRDGRMPGAGEVGLVDYLAEQAADLQPVIAEGLRALDALAGDRGAERFADLAPEVRAEVLSAHAESDPGLLPGLLFHTYTGYYQQRAVVEALGYEHRPPFPEGYPLAPTDPHLLDGVRRRAPLYRDA